MSGKKTSFAQMIIAGLVSGSVLAVVVSFLLLSESTKIEEQIKADFQTSLHIFRSKREWQEQSLSELMGPVYMQLRRTKTAFDRWNSQNLYLEMKVIESGNRTILNLLLTKGQLIPPELRDCSDRLIQHYDVWLEEFEKKRLAEKPDLETKFVFAGPRGFPFPSDCDAAFRKKFGEIWKEAYGDAKS